MKTEIAIALVLAAAAAPAAAANLVTNGSFEQPGGIVRNQLAPGYIPGWTYSDNGSGFDIYEDDSQDGLTAADGSHYLSFGHNGSFGGSISQTIATLAGHAYRLSLATAEQQGDDPAQSFHVVLTTAFGGFYDFYVGNPGSSFTTTLQNFYPDSPTTITITDATPPGSGGSSNLALDAVSVVDLAAGGVPEPASWALLLGGFGLLGTAMRRRRMAAVAA